MCQCELAMLVRVSAAVSVTSLPQEHMKKVGGRPGFVAIGTAPSSVTRSIIKMNIRM